MIHKPQSSRLTRYARTHTSEDAKAKRKQKRDDGERERLRWAMIRAQVYDLCGGHCVVSFCGRQVYLTGRNPFSQMHAHHVVFRSAGGSDDIANLAGVCGECHDLIHRYIIDLSGTWGRWVTTRLHEGKAERID